MDEIAAQICAERKGLEMRNKNASADASFLMAAMENDGVSSSPSSRLDALTDDVLNCERRLAVVTRQIERMGELRKGVETLFDDRQREYGQKPAGEAPRARRA